MIGPLGVDIDHGLRTVDYGRAAAEIERTMDEATRLWVQRFVDGVNHYQDTARDLPHDFRVCSTWSASPGRSEDVFAMGRLAGTDVNWLVWMDLLPLRARAGWDALWARLVEGGEAAVAGSGGDSDTARAQRWLGGLSKSGSNSLAVAADRTDTGGALMANDPHLGILVPNVWLIAGIKSPSYHAVGLMAPGLPIFAIGRNPDVAWGGTNMRAASSDLYDVSTVPASQIDERSESIGVRWWFDSDVTVRETRWGPIVTDVPLLADMGLPPLALKWTGHDASDEIGAMLAVSRARTFAESAPRSTASPCPARTCSMRTRTGTSAGCLRCTCPAATARPPISPSTRPSTTPPGRRCAPLRTCPTATTRKPATWSPPTTGRRRRTCRWASSSRATTGWSACTP